jgi:hypothetical protein
MCRPINNLHRIFKKVANLTYTKEQTFHYTSVTSMYCKMKIQRANGILRKHSVAFLILLYYEHQVLVHFSEFWNMPNKGFHVV